MARTSSLNSIAFPVEILTKPLIHCIPPPFSLKTPLFLTEKCFVASPAQKSAPKSHPSRCFIVLSLFLALIVGMSRIFPVFFGCVFAALFLCVCVCVCSMPGIDLHVPHNLWIEHEVSSKRCSRKGVGNGKTASEMRQTCVQNAAKWVLFVPKLSVLKRCVPKTLAFAFSLRSRSKMRCLRRVF